MTAPKFFPGGTWPQFLTVISASYCSCAQHFARTGFLDEDNELHIAGVARCRYVATDVAGKSLLPVNAQLSFAQEGLLCWHCRLLTFVNNPFSSQNGGPISDPNSTLSAPTVQEYQLQLPFPQFTGLANDVRLIHVSRTATAGGEELLQRNCNSSRPTPGRSRLVTPPRRTTT